MKSAGIRILVPVTYSELGGSQVFLLKLMDSMKDDPAFSFSCWLFQHGPLEDELRKRRIPFVFHPVSLKNPFFLLQMINALKREHPDIIYLHATRFLALAAKLAGIPCVERINMSRTGHAGGWCRFPFIDRLFTSFNTRALAVSDAIKKQLERHGVASDKIKVIRNFVELDRFAPCEEKKALRKELDFPQDKIIVLNIGRFTAAKAQSDFLKIAAGVHADCPDLFFLLIGKGELENALKEEIRSLGLEGCVKLLPYRKDIEKIYAASDILLHTAHWDPLANVILEAMSAGLTVIASEVDGTPEAVTHNQTGLMFTPGDIPGASAFLKQTAADPDLRNRFGIAARKHMEEFHSLPVVLRQYREIFTHP